MRGRGRDIVDILDLVQNCLPSPPHPTQGYHVCIICGGLQRGDKTLL